MLDIFDVIVLYMHYHLSAQIDVSIVFYMVSPKTTQVDIPKCYT